MNKFLQKLEIFIDHIIPYLLIGLLVVIIGEIFYPEQFHHYQLEVDIYDTIVILAFATDLAFKYNRVRKLKKFVKKYWLDIIATIPFFLIFRVLEVFRISEFLETGQQILHEAAGVEKEAAAISRESKAVKLTRTERFLRYFKSLGRFPRFIKAMKFFEKPKH